MSLDLAIDQLLETGWSLLDTSDHEYSPSARLYPTPERVTREFRMAGVDLRIRRVDLFDCFRAEWTDPDSARREAVVGATREEAAVYALVRLRRRLAESAAPAAPSA